MGIVLLILAALPGVALASPATAADSFNSFLSTTTPVESSKPILVGISSLSTRAAKYSEPVLSTVDAGRYATANFLSGQIRATAPRLPVTAFASATPAAASPSQFNWSGIGRGIVGILWTVYFYILVIARYVVSKIALSYPLLAAAVLLVLYKIFKRIRR